MERNRLGYQQHSQSTPMALPHRSISYSERYKKKVLDAFITLYPFINAAHEGTRFLYQLFYLLGKSSYYSPELHLLGLIITRVSGQQAMAAQDLREKRKQERLAHAQATSSNVLTRTVRSVIARLSNAVSEHTRSALVLAVFAFKLLEWYYTSLEQRLDGRRMVPPPPPPAIPPCKDGVPLPADVSVCPLCKKGRTNPAMVSTSGYVYCYPCIYRFIDKNGWCPVTKMPARVEHIRRLYQTT